MIQTPNINVDLKSVVGLGYTKFWRFKGRYRVVKGGRASKKSTTTALNIIYRMMEYPLANTLVVRKVFDTHKDSTFAQLKWATRQLKVSHLWKFQLSPLQVIYKPTGQKILFRGLDDPLKITSITVDIGHLCWVWFEEAYQVTNEDDFDKIDLSIRGELPPGYFKQITLTFNPWNEKHWLNERFFKEPDSDTMAITTNYLLNEFLGQDDLAVFEKMRIKNPRRYNVEGLGNWGIAEGIIYDNWTEETFNKDEIIRERKGIIASFGLDFGYTSDPTAFNAILIDNKEKEIFIFDEFYKRNMLNDEIATTIKNKGYAKEKIIADSAEPKSIEEIRRNGVPRIRAAEKGKDSINNGIQKIKQYQIIVHPKCTNHILELGNYVWDKSKEGKQLNRPIDDFNHALDAFRYSMEVVKKSRKVRAAKSIY